MGLFHDHLATLDGVEGVNLPEGFIEGLTTAYDDDLSIPGAKVAAVEGELADALAQIAALKVANYDLLMAITSEDNDNENEGTDNDGDDDTPTVDDLFTTDDKDNK